MADSSRPLVQWSFLQVKKFKNSVAPTPCFLQSATQIGSKILFFGGCDSNGDASNQLLLYDTVSFLWTSPANSTDFQEHHPGGRYGHSATLVEMHPPKIMIYGGMQAGGTFEFAAPDSVEDEEADNPGSRHVMSVRRKGKKSALLEGTDEAVYFLTLNAEHWEWSKPITRGVEGNRKPPARAEHSACKTGHK